MNQDQTSASARSIALGRFYCEMYRYRSLVLEWWWLLLLIAMSAVALRYFLLTTAPPSFKSEGLMIVNVKLSLPTGNVYSEELNNFLGTQVALLQSATVSNRALFRLQSNKPEWRPVPVTLHVSVSPKTSVFELRAVGATAPYVQAWLDTVMDEYIQVKKELVPHTSENTRSSLGEAITNLGQELLKGKEEMVAYGSTNSVVFLQDQGNSAANRLTELTKQRDELQAELQLLKTLTLDENVDLSQTMVRQSLGFTPITKPGMTQAPA